MRPLPFLLVCLAGWMNRHQQTVIAYLQEEIRVLQEQLGKRPRFNDEQFRAVLRSTGVQPLRLPARSPNLNAFAERFVRTIKE